MAYKARIFSSNPARRRWCLAISCGSNVLWRSRGVSRAFPQVAAHGFLRVAVATVVGRCLVAWFDGGG